MTDFSIKYPKSLRAMKSTNQASHFIKWNIKINFDTKFTRRSKGTTFLSFLEKKCRIVSYYWYHVTLYNVLHVTWRWAGHCQDNPHCFEICHERARFRPWKSKDTWSLLSHTLKLKYMVSHKIYKWKSVYCRSLGLTSYTYIERLSMLFIRSRWIYVNTCSETPRRFLGKIDYKEHSYAAMYIRVSIDNNGWLNNLHNNIIHWTCQCKSLFKTSISFTILHPLPLENNHGIYHLEDAYLGLLFSSK